MNSSTFHIRSRATAAGVHLLISVAIAAAAAALVFGLWYRWPYRVISGGQGLFVLLISVDLALGPLLTFAVFDRAKKWASLRRDLVVIGLFQLSALAYGLYTVYAARPVALIFEVDRFRVISAADVNISELPLAPEPYRRLPLTGPWTLGARAAQQGKEHSDALSKGLEGIDIGQRPPFWQPYELFKNQALARSRPIGILLDRYPGARPEIESILGDLQLSTGEVRFLPLIARKEWVVLLDKSGEVVGFAPYDGFFR